jgi:glycerophosphoryl diester phosphodiesterase
MKRPTVNRPLIFAHRGASKVAPENTLPAFEQAIGLGADGVELDVQYTSDGKLICIHNMTLEKTTNGSGRVVSHTLDQIRKLDAGAWFSPQFAGTRVPVLEEVLDLLKGKLLINIELKVLDTRQNGLGADVVKAVRARDMVDQIVLSSFNPFALRAALLAGREFQGGLLLAPDLPGWTRWPFTRRYSLAQGVHPELKMVDAAYVEGAKRAGLPLRVWTVNEEEGMRRMIGFSVDSIITDYPDRLAKRLGVR